MKYNTIFTKIYNETYNNLLRYIIVHSNNLNVSINKDKDTKIINNKIIKTSYNEYIIVVNNIIYTFDNFNEDYSEEEIIKLINDLTIS